MNHWLIVPAAGVGRRFGGAVPKQYQTLMDRTVAETTLSRLLAVPAITHILVAINPQDFQWHQLPIAHAARVRTVAGGAERAASVHLALAALANEAAPDDWVLVHDLVRPCVRVADIENLIAELATDPIGGILATPVRDTLKQVFDDPARDNRIQRNVPRDHLWAALTPQMFRYGLLCRALASAAAAGILPTDEAAAIEHLGLHPRVVAGRADNIKITTADDLGIAAAILRQQQTER